MKKIIFLFFAFFNLSLYSQTLPYPDGDALYSEYTSLRSAVYLKKPLVSYGYIVMKGAKNFLFKQTAPIVIEVRQKGDKLTFKKEDTQPIEIPNTQSGDNIAFLFDKDSSLDNFNVSKSFSNGKDFYLIVPKKIDKVTKIELVSKKDKVETIKLFFKDKTLLTYEFKNTVTGTLPDEKLFQ
ncbi:MAG TPA: hypothetical protein PLO89_01100 [Spirochaetota bacterium]|nr:hypothetical protein [Spirochaetota bacterium]